MNKTIRNNSVIIMNFAIENGKNVISYDPPGHSFQFASKSTGRVLTGDVTFQIGENLSNYVIAGVLFESKPDSNGLACVSAFNLTEAGANISFNFGNHEKSEGGLTWIITDAVGIPVVFSKPDPQIGNDGDVNS
jgi:hypothetical protein